jgi:hypothetical protein
MRCSSSRLCFAASAALALAGCTDLASADLKTAGMSATITVVADGSGQTTATAQLNVDDSSTDFVTLSNGDTLFTTVDGDSQTMTENDNLFNEVTYSTTFSGKDSAGTEYTIGLRRLNDTSAPDSTCTLPAAFTITAPTSGATFSRSGSDIDVNLATSGASDPVSYSLSGDCGDSAFSQGPESAGSSGSFTIARGTIDTGSDIGAATCNMTLTITLASVGNLDPGYGGGGSIQCEQTRTVTFTSTP